jgi:hypothetical protein
VEVQNFAVSNNLIQRINAKAKTWKAGQNFHPKTSENFLKSLMGVHPDHHEFLPAPSAFTTGLNTEDDPRYQLIQQLKSNIAPTGSIVAYNASFEISRLKDLASSFPQEAEYLQSLIDRFIDLLIPFKNAWFYLPEMGGSASIKSVLPAIDPKFSYADLKVNNGGDASGIYLAAINGVFKEEWNITREALLRYCERDSEGMVVVYRALKDSIK